MDNDFDGISFLFIGLGDAEQNRENRELQTEWIPAYCPRGRHPFGSPISVFTEGTPGLRQAHVPPTYAEATVGKPIIFIFTVG